MYPVLKIMGQGGRTNPAALWKDAMRLAGVDAGLPRLPLTPASAEERENVRRELERFGALAGAGAGAR
jgi:4-hydroxy-tetrahydrodipicolinate synthase